MKKILRRPQFLLDLAEELTGLKEKAGAEVATAWYASLKDSIRLLQRHPYLGRARMDLAPQGIRSWRVNDYPRWLVFYTVDRHGAVVLHRVRQGTMNLVVLKLES